MSGTAFVLPLDEAGTGQGPVLTVGHAPAEPSRRLAARPDDPHTTTGMRPAGPHHQPPAGSRLPRTPLSKQALAQVGGKGASLARMATGGLPVPPGFHVTTDAYRNFVTENGLRDRILAAVSPGMIGDLAGCERAARQIAEFFLSATMPESIAAEIRAAYVKVGGTNGDLPVAVRSSATAEDLPDASFAGQQDSYLNIRGEAAVLAAVKRCWGSLWNARAIDYRARAGIPQDEVALAVVVQELVDADAAGIMFTANPMTGDRHQVLINAAWGLGEAVVGGQVTPDTIVVDRRTQKIVEERISDKTTMTVRTVDGTVEQAVPDAKRTKPTLSGDQAVRLADLSGLIEKMYGQPMDIEWARQGDRFAIVQARPITNLMAAAPEREEWNDSRQADLLWTSANLGEAIPSVMTPSTWSVVKIFMSEAMSIARIGEYEMSGNICGRFYLNLSLAFGLGSAVGLGKFIRSASAEAFGYLPEGLDVPPLPVSRWRVITEAVPTVIRFLRRLVAYQKTLPAMVAGNPDRCANLVRKLRSTTSTGELSWLWSAEVEPLLRDTSRMLAAGGRLAGVGPIRTRPKLTKMVGDEDANAMLTGLGAGGDQLASLGPVVGLAMVARGELDKETYAREWGHRCPDEFEISAPRPSEDPGWVDRQVAGMRGNTSDATSMLERQVAARDAAWERFGQEYPGRAEKMRARVAGLARAAGGREAARSELIRAFGVLRAYVLRAGELTGRGDDLFFLSIDEIVSVLRGDGESLLALVPSRRLTYEHYRSLPVYPTLIRGTFEPEVWAVDPDRRSDLFDATKTHKPRGDAISGFAGAAGIVEGTARVLTSVDDGEELKPGEILVTTVTNIGWTPLFPRAAAVVTDVGAPLSHAAIVARELGIPAVVGCGNAVARLHSGDHIRVNGGAGTVELLQPATAAH